MLNRNCTISKPFLSNLKGVRTSFSLLSTDWLCLQHAQMPRMRDLAIFVPITTTTTIDRQTDCFIPCACVGGNKIMAFELIVLLDAALG